MMPLNRFAGNLLLAAVLAILAIAYLSTAWPASLFLFIAAGLRTYTACSIWRAWR